MKNPIFIALLLFVNSVRALLYPLWAEILPLFFSKLAARRDFERLNLVDPMSQSFRNDGKVGHILFHVSSEGELEQIRPLLSYYLEQQYNLELVYTSESVEKKCQQLAIEAEGRIRLFRLPVLTYFFFSWKGAQSLQSWSSAKRIVMCRYDFFPELLLMGCRPANQFVLVNATLKGKEKMSFIVSWYYRSIYGLFNTIVAATATDKTFLQSLVSKRTILEVFDFRIMQIDRRVRSSSNVFKQKKIDSFVDQLVSRFPKSKRVIMGSAWPNEMKVLNNRELLAKISLGEILFVIAPHQLSYSNFDQIEACLKKIISVYHLDVPIYSLTKNASADDLVRLWEDFNLSPGIIISQMPGILCELYTIFGHAFVGGGHGRSIHSVLEPFIAGAHIFCGPKTHRSTEYDFVKEFSDNSIVKVDQLESFYTKFKKTESFAYNSTQHQHFISKSVGRFLAVVQQLHLG